MAPYASRHSINETTGKDHEGVDGAVWSVAGGKLTGMACDSVWQNTEPGEWEGGGGSGDKGTDGKDRLLLGTSELVTPSSLCLSPCSSFSASAQVPFWGCPVLIPTTLKKAVVTKCGHICPDGFSVGTLATQMLAHSFCEHC